MHLEDIKIHSNLKDYTVSFEENNAFIKELSEVDNAVFVVDEKVFSLYQNSLLNCLPKDRIIIQNANENAKTIDTVCDVWEKIMAFAPRKNMTLVSIGGGIIQDITGFVASTLYRGIKWIFVPTTLLAMTDSCIGAKTSLNFKKYKNLVGTFYSPSHIHIYPGFINSLSRLDYYSGVGEMAKLHLMNGREYTDIFRGFLQDIENRNFDVLLKCLKNSLEIKKSYIENDEFDTGRRNLLNYGHCFGHAIESSTDFSIPHGQAVVLGMILANREAVNQGVLSADNAIYIEENILKPILVADVPEINIDATVAAMRQDKKNIGQGLALIMLNNDFQCIKITDMTEQQAKEVLENKGL